MSNKDNSWKIFEVNSADWVLAQTKEQVIDWSKNEYGEEYYKDYIQDLRVVSKKLMNELIFIDDAYAPEWKQVGRTFKEELEKRIKNNPKVEMFASTEY